LLLLFFLIGNQRRNKTAGQPNNRDDEENGALLIIAREVTVVDKDGKPDKAADQECVGRDGFFHDGYSFNHD
jgi:hypothetical protein